MQASAPLPASEVREALAGVLARSAQDERESLLERFIEWLAPRLDTHEVQLFGDVLLGLLGAAALAVLVLVLWRAWSLYRAPALEEERVSALELVSVRERLGALAAAARAARERGDLRLALRLAFHALLLALGGRGDLALNAAWTNRELLRRGKPSHAARALLEPLVRELEPKEFGCAAVSAADVERLEALLAPHLARAGGAP